MRTIGEVSKPPAAGNPVRRRRLTRFGIPAAVVAFIVLCVAMCGPSNNSNNSSNNTGKPTVSATAPKPAPNAAPPPAPPPPPEAKGYVEGLVESVSGNAIALRTRTGSATVDFSPQTRVVEQTPAQLTDVTPGSCINVRATPQSAPPPAAITAAVVTITPAAQGKCPPPAGYFGTVTSVSGSTIAVSGLGPAPTNVTVADSTTYNKQTPTGSDAIAHGRCLAAQGADDGGTLQAMTIALQACPPMGRPHHHLEIPHLPIHLPFHHH